MTRSSCLLAVITLALAPTLAHAQIAMLRPGAVGPSPAALAAEQRPDGQMRYALGAGANYLSGTTASAASFNLGAESAVATTESRWRFAGKALWSRSANGNANENVTVLLVQESQHRWGGGTWLRERFTMFPALRPGDALRSTLETGVAIATSRFCTVTVGMVQRFEGNAAVAAGDPAFATTLAIKLP